MKTRNWKRPRARSTKGLTPHDAFLHALGVICGPWPKGELVILHDPEVALNYMEMVRGRHYWPEAEDQFDTWTDAQVRRYFDLVLGQSRGRHKANMLDELFEQEGWA
jgi:hypothetical protein